MSDDDPQRKFGSEAFVPVRRVIPRRITRPQGAVELVDGRVVEQLSRWVRGRARTWGKALPVSNRKIVVEPCNAEFARVRVGKATFGMGEKSDFRRCNRDENQQGECHVLSPLSQS